MIFRKISLPAAFLIAASVPGNAHIVLSQTTFEAGARYAAFFKVEHGCDGSPTIALRVSVPDGVTVLRTPDKPGWTLSPQLSGAHIAGVTWKGRLEAKAKDQFGLFVQLPQRNGPLYFPVLQQCEKGETRWTDIPKEGQAWRDVPRPAPVVQLIAAAAVPSAMIMAGNIMIETPWARATPPGAPTGAAYLTITNHGAVPDMLLGGSTPAAAQLQIHEMSNAGGIMSMRPVKSLAIPPGGTVKISPDGGYHLMLAGLKAPLKQGMPIEATLNFARAGKVKVEFPVEAIGARGPAGGAMPGMDHSH